MVQELNLTLVLVKDHLKSCQTPGKPSICFNLENKRGLAIIISCDYVGESRQTVPTANTDGDSIHTTLKRFDYDIHRLKNEKASENEIKHFLESVNGYLKQYDGDPTNADGKAKAIIFAFAGKRGAIKTSVGMYITSNDGWKIYVKYIVSKFLGMGENVTKIPKLFLFDVCCIDPWQSGVIRSTEGDERYHANYRIDYATVPYDCKSGDHTWMQSIATKLPCMENASYDDIMAVVRKMIYEDWKGNHPLPIMVDRLITGPLKLYCIPKEENKE